MFRYRGQDRHRCLHPVMKEWGDETNGAAQVLGPCGDTLLVLFSDGGGWEHVSVSLPRGRRLPNWDEMCAVKRTFWSNDDTVLQFHPQEEAYVHGANVLHLWRQAGTNHPLPPKEFI